MTCGSMAVPPLPTRRIASASSAGPRTWSLSRYYRHRLPELMRTKAAGQSQFDRFDAIVVGEGQDFAESWWSVLLAGLRHSVDGGLYVFSDEHQRVFGRQGRPSVPLLTLDLTENLRNTKQIAQTFNSLAPALMQLRAGNGDPGPTLQLSVGVGLGQC